MRFLPEEEVKDNLGVRTQSPNYMKFHELPYKSYETLTLFLFISRIIRQITSKGPFLFWPNVILAGRGGKRDECPQRMTICHQSQLGRAQAFFSGHGQRTTLDGSHMDVCMWKGGITLMREICRFLESTANSNSHLRTPLDFAINGASRSSVWESIRFNWESL